ncbi:hypothetical protein C0992_007472 [Termitomyces sp. T32_za158]|nr:hypothetical protein C0992_007472 [Termitomyces sp. T32_za158]
MFTHFYAGYKPSQLVPATYDHNDSQPRGTDLIGQPISFAHGQFAGSTIRAELSEIQQASLGRKYARVDRRPLDPPPVVQLRFFQVEHAGTAHELEKEISNYEEVQVLGLVCTVDLFPVPSIVKSPSKSEGKRRMQSKAHNQSSHTPSAPSSSRLPLDRQRPLDIASPDPCSPNRPFGEAATVTPSPTLSTSSSHSGYRPPHPPHTAPSLASDIVHYVNNHPVQESSKMTTALVGATFVQPSVIDYRCKKAILFVFAVCSLILFNSESKYRSEFQDLAVKIEGSFVLRYRFFDLFSRPCNYQDLAIQAECYGGAFHVYSTKEFPGLQASTELTKHLARWGVRLNTRETERRRRKKGEILDDSSSSFIAKKRKRPFVDAEGDFKSDDEK